ncbi:hypothetical protein BS47DRAFT_1335620 [Hydnum rufescens UP504]|uniref:Uncharacterized protein n=1 Tax=Hydnum rufescens UP504 TaxID=1448309 RepID=A0A9P6BBF7_9AGAM|nr:hypothetical protein BS47DRAFT_1335620 [Hydnum rufescens UP504]
MTPGGCQSHKGGSLNSQGDAASLLSTPLHRLTAESSNRSSTVSKADLEFVVRELLGSISESDQLATSSPVSPEIIQEIEKPFDLVRDALNKDKSFRQNKHVDDRHELFTNGACDQSMAPQS